MKKIYFLVSILLLSSCSLLELGNDPKYSVMIYNSEPYLISSEYVKENSKPKNELLTAYVGYTVIDNRIYQKQRFQNDEFRASENASVLGVAVPVKFEKNQRAIPFGEVNLPDGKYVLIPSDIVDYYYLISPTGQISDKIAAYKRGKVTIVPSEIKVSPSSFRFNSVKSSKSIQSNPTKGFDVKYGGVQAERIIFTYFDYSTTDKKGGYFENITFPINQDVVEIEGFGIKIFKAEKHRLEYIILN